MTLSAPDLAQLAAQISGNGSGVPISRKLTKEALSFLEDQVNASSVTLETGAGLSTVLFALKGARHTSIVRQPEAVDWVCEYCRSHNIPTERIEFQVGRSEDALPHLQTWGLDLALIDGRYGFPAPFIDWYYIAGLLKVGGLLIIGDTRVWTGRVLRDYLLAEPHWRLFANMPNSVAFLKLRDGSQWKEWDQQKYVLRQSSRPDSGAVPAKAGHNGSAVATGAADAPAQPAQLTFQCNICGQPGAARMEDLGREISSCLHCGSTVRFRSIVEVLATELLAQNLTLPEFPTRPDLTGIGLSDWDGYALPLARLFAYTNTFTERQPRLDIAAIDPALEGTCDFVIAAEAFEHVIPPVSIAFENARRLLKPGGLLILTVPYLKTGQTIEHYPDLHEYRIEEGDGRLLLRNVTREGVEQVFENPVFHGRGRSLEMRVFSEASLMQDLKNAGFSKIQIHRAPDFVHGIYWNVDWSLPISARVG